MPKPIRIFSISMFVGFWECRDQPIKSGRDQRPPQANPGRRSTMVTKHDRPSTKASPGMGPKDSVPAIHTGHTPAPLPQPEDAIKISGTLCPKASTVRG